MTPSHTDRHFPTGRSDTGTQHNSASRYVEALDRQTIAHLTARDISRMTPNELVRVVLASPLGATQVGRDYRLEYKDRETLTKLAHLARFSCRTDF
jgi:hypothetical protein